MDFESDERYVQRQRFLALRVLPPLTAYELSPRREKLCREESASFVRTRWRIEHWLHAPSDAAVCITDCISLTDFVVSVVSSTCWPPARDRSKRVVRVLRSSTSTSSAGARPRTASRSPILTPVTNQL